MIDGLRLFQLGDDGNVAVVPGTVRGDDLLDHADIGGAAHERESDGIDAVVEAEFEVFAVFFGQRRNGKRDAGKVDAFVLAQRAAVDDVAENVFAADAANAQFDQAVGEQDAGAGGDLAGEIGECGRDARGGAGHVLRCDGDDRAGFQQHGLVAFERSGADFRALQILQDADGAALALGGAAQALDVVGVIGVGAVGEVEAGDVHAEAEQVAHEGFGVAGGADGADDLGATGGRIRHVGIREVQRSSSRVIVGKGSLPLPCLSF